MTLDEIFRRIVRGHLWVILACIAVPLVAVGALQLRAQPAWTATVRVQVSTQDPSSTTEADALSSRVLALATTPSLVKDALDAEHLAGDAGRIARTQVTSERLGESPLVDLTVTRPDQKSASLLVGALAQRVIDFMNHASYASFDAAMERTTTRLDEATTTRDQINQRLLTTKNSAARQALQSQLQDAQASVDQLSAAKASMELASIDHDEVVLVDPGHPSVAEAPSTLVPRTALALILGLLLGVAAAVTLETLNPRVAGSRALARLLSAPLLGNADQRLPAVTNAMTLGARRHGVETVVLLGVDDEDDAIVHEMLDVLAPQESTPEVERIREDLRNRRLAATGDGAAGKGSKGPARGPAKASGKGSAKESGKGAVPNAAASRTKVQESAPQDPEAEDVAEGGPSIPLQVRFSDLVRVTPAQEPTAGVVVVTSGTPRQRDVDVVEDILAAMRWPVIGIVEAHTHLSRRW